MLHACFTVTDAGQYVELACSTQAEAKPKPNIYFRSPL